jgi:glycine hydroxymethyltransferase
MVTDEGLKKDSDLPKKINKAIIPGLQGGPHEHQIAGIAVCLKQASTPNFKKYGAQIVKNAKTLAEELKKYGFKLITDGTDNHLLLIDVRSKGVLGQEVENLLGQAGITVNKNAIPFDPNPPFSPSGIRMGTPAITTRGMKEKEMIKIAGWINEAISNPKSVKKIKNEVRNLCKKFPLSKCKY